MKWCIFNLENNQGILFRINNINKCECNQGYYNNSGMHGVHSCGN